MDETTAATDTTGTVVSMGDKRIVSTQFEKYKGRKGQTDRLALISPQLHLGKIYFHESMGKRWLFHAPDAKSDPKLAELCMEKLGAPMQRLGVVVFHYRAEDGVVEDKEKCAGTVKVWILSESKYRELEKLNKEWPLMDHGQTEAQSDIILSCTEEQYQRMTITPTKEAHWKSKPEWYSHLNTRQKEAFAALPKIMGRQLDGDEIMEMFGMSDSAVTNPTGGSGEINLNEVLE